MGQASSEDSEPVYVIIVDEEGETVGTDRRYRRKRAIQQAIARKEAEWGDEDDLSSSRVWDDVDEDYS